MTPLDDFQKSFRKTEIALLFSGIAIYPPKTEFLESLLKFIFYFNIPWLYTDVFAEFYWLVQGAHEGKSVSELSFIAPCATICLLATAKSTPLFKHRKAILEVVGKLRELHPEEKEDLKIESNGGHDKILKKEDETIVRKSAKFLNFVTNMQFYASCLVVVVFTTLPLMSMSYDYYTKGETDLKLPFLVVYHFFDPFTPTMWPIMYFHQIWSTLIAAFNVVGADTLLYVFCACTQMHFELLAKEFENFVSSSDVITQRRLVQLVKKHQVLIHLVEQIDLMYSKSNLFNITTSSILICLSGFNIMILEDRVGVFAFLTFLTMNFTQISLLCLFGDMLMRSSLKLSNAIYNSRWYDTKGRTRKNVLLCLIRAQRPCKLTAFKFADVSLTALTTILSRSWSLFALLRTMYD